MAHYSTAFGRAHSSALHAAFALRCPGSGRGRVRRRRAAAAAATRVVGHDPASAAAALRLEARDAPARPRLSRRRIALLVVAVMLAVAALSAVGFFADRINGGLSRDARQMLGGDAIVASDQPAPPVFEQRRRRSASRPRRPPAFPSMGRAAESQGGASRLVTREGGQRRLSAARPAAGEQRAEQAEAAVAGAPAPGTAWVDPALLEALGLRSATAAARRCEPGDRAADPDRARSRRGLPRSRRAC